MIILIWIVVIWIGFYAASYIMKPDTKPTPEKDPIGEEIKVDHQGKEVSLPTLPEHGSESSEPVPPTSDFIPEEKLSGTATHAREASSMESSIPSLYISIDADQQDLNDLPLPNMPYSIYVGAYLDLKECETTQRELISNLLPAYILPIDIHDKVGQSLFGVTEDGKWCRVLVGHFGTKQESRKTLSVMMNYGTTDQLEIMRFTYAIECGRFLDTQEADKLFTKLTQDGFHPYEQTYPVDPQGSLSRILVGCFFSSQGAHTLKGTLDTKGYSCKIVQR